MKWIPANPISARGLCTAMFSLFLVLNACAKNSDPSPNGISKSASVTFTVTWQTDTENSEHHFPLAIDCDAFGIHNIIARVHNTDDVVVASGTWACNIEGQEGVISKVPPGLNLLVRVLGTEIGSDDIIFQGTSEPFDLSAGQTHNAGTIEMTAVTYSIIASTGSNGSITPSDEVIVDRGADQTFTISPDPHYQVAYLLVDGESQGPLTQYTFNDVASDHTIRAIFTTINFTISASSGPNGSIAPSGEVTVNSGANQTFTITPDPNYSVTDLIVDGESQGPLTQYTFNDVASDHTIRAIFTIIDYTITASSGPNGSIAPSGEVIVNSGADQTFTITPDPNYSVTDLLVDGESQGAMTEYTFTDVTSDHTISASFVINFYTVNFTAGDGGYLDGAATQHIAHGSDCTPVEAIPYSSYQFIDWSGDVIGFENPLTITQVTANMTIRANFALEPYWTPISTTNAPEARFGHTAIWTGSEMIVWGGNIADPGFTNTGGIYDPEQDEWIRATPLTNAPEGRFIHTGIWTGTEMIVWGGYADGKYFQTGGRYDPVSNQWNSLPTTGGPTERANHTAVWTGSEMIVWGGNTYSAIPLNTGGRYNPDTGLWQPISTNDTPTARTNHSAVWTGTTMLIWGGWDGSGYLNDGAEYDPVLDRWTALTTVDAPTGRSGQKAIWNGTDMIIWGGYRFISPVEYYFDTGGVYNSPNQKWQETAISGAPDPRTAHSAIWTGQKMVVWGGMGPTGLSGLNTGGVYLPEIDSWTEVTTTDAPSVRYNHTAVWTGTGMIVWGGRVGSSTRLNTGGVLWMP